MNKRNLGKSGLTIAPLVLGGNVFGWTTDERQSSAILDAFVAAGFNCIDTADIYASWAPGNKGGESETIIGKWLHASGKRGQVIIVTKVGMEMEPGMKGLSRSYITTEVEASLKRLQTDYIDLYLSHLDDAAVPLEETLEAYSRLVEQGKVRAIGASNYKGARLAQAIKISRQHDWPQYQVLQPDYNLYDRADYESDLEPVCVQQGLGVITYYSLASGFLTGKYRSEQDLTKSPRGAAMKDRLNERGLRILATLDEIAAYLHATPAQVALAWLMARPSVTAPISSVTSVDQLNELAKAVQLKLDQSALETLNTASAWT
ncbi:MAG: aldo/keto reductase [Steroidobacteraceae bacterium]